MLSCQQGFVTSVNSKTLVFIPFIILTGLFIAFMI